MQVLEERQGSRNYTAAVGGGGGGTGGVGVENRAYPAVPVPSNNSAGGGANDGPGMARVFSTYSDDDGRSDSLYTRDL